MSDYDLRIREALARGDVDAAFALRDERDRTQRENPPPAPAASPANESDPLLAAAAEAEAEAEQSRRRAAGARHLVSQASDGADLSDFSDDDVVQMWSEQQARQREADLANDVEANIAAATDHNRPAQSFDWDTQRRLAWKAANPGRPCNGTPWNVRKGGE